MINIFVVLSDYYHHFGLYFVNNEFHLSLLILQLFSARIPSQRRLWAFVDKNAKQIRIKCIMLYFVWDKPVSPHCLR